MAPRDWINFKQQNNIYYEVWKKCKMFDFLMLYENIEIDQSESSIPV